MDLEFGKKNIKLYFLYAISILISFPIKIFYSRTLTVEDFGALFALISLTTILAPISNLGFSESLNYFIPKYKEKKEKIKKIFSTTITLQLLGGTILLFLFLLFSKQIAIYYLKKEIYTIIVKIFSLLFLTIPLTYTIMNIYRSSEKEEYYIYIDITKNFMILTGSIMLYYYTNLNLKSILLLWLTATIITNLYYIKKAYKKIIKKIELKVYKKTFKEIFYYSYINLIGSSIAIFFSYTDTIMITIISTTLQTGYYNAVLPIASIMLITTMPLNIILYPYLSKIHHEKKNVKEELKNIQTIILLINTIVYTILFLNSKIIIYILLGEKYLYSTTILQILLVAFYINSFNQTFHIYYSAIGEVKKRIKVLTYSLITNIILNTILINYYGAKGAAIATLTSFIIMYILYSKEVLKKYHIKILITTLTITLINIILLQNIYNNKTIIQKIILTITVTLLNTTIIILLNKKTIIPITKQIIKKIKEKIKKQTD